MLSQAFGAAPSLAWMQLGCAVLAVSTAAVAFRELPDVPPLLLASWRLQATSVLLAGGACYQGWREGPELLARWVHALPLMFVSGVCLAAHFGLWVWGLQNTSMPHSLLLVCSTPLLLSLGSLLMCFPTSLGEIGSSILGVLGVWLMAADVSAKNDVTWYGDLMSLGAAFFFIGYMLVGHQLRQWMPLFLYAFPVTFTSAVVLALTSTVVEGAGMFTDGTAHGDRGYNAGIVGWTLDSRSFMLVAYLALGPGIIGHTGFNGVLRTLSPLVVSISLTFEPLIGSLLGWATGFAAPPSWLTGVGGAILISAIVLVVVVESKKQK